LSTRLRDVYLGIGSNVDTGRNIQSGIRALNDAFTDVRLSPAYQTSAVGFDGEDFINLAASCSTAMHPLELKAWLNALESAHGRARGVPKFSDRTLDIDILLYDDLWLRVPGLELPRPEIRTFAHVLRPLADLAPDLTLPDSDDRIADLWRNFAEKPTMEVIEIENMTKGT
jgi:2-amino-4-hydroxy-6-hydroxymethyldihydropteridine diphosphokinase